MSRSELTPETALALLARVTVGRVVVTRDALAEIVPVIYRVAAKTVVFAVPAGSPLPSNPEGSVATFQADTFDPHTECGWHVQAFGVFELSLTPGEVAVAGVLVPRPWACGEEASQEHTLTLQVVRGHIVGPPTDLSRRKVPLQPMHHCRAFHFRTLAVVACSRRASSDDTNPNCA
jgi:Pyridoxamine 5'-phosphate oxidase